MPTTTASAPANFPPRARSRWSSRFGNSNPFSIDIRMGPSPCSLDRGLTPLRWGAAFRHPELSGEHELTLPAP
jgi:hypothetical protein